MTPSLRLAQAAALSLLLAAPAALAQEAETPAGPRPVVPTWMEGHRAPVGETFLVERAEISPDGRRVVYVAALGDARKLRVEALDGSLSQTADLTGAELRDVMWAGSDHLILTVMTQSIEDLGVDNGLMSAMAYNVPRQSYETLLRNRNDISTMGNRVATRMEQQPRVMAMVFERPSVRVSNGRLEAVVDTLAFDGSCRYNLYRVDLDTGAPVRDATGVQRAEGMILNGAGEPAALQQDGRIKLRTGGGWRLVRARELNGAVQLMGLGRNGTVLVRTGEGRDARLLEIAMNGRVAGEITVDGLSGLDPVFDDQTGRLLGVVGLEDDGTHTYEFFEPALARVWPSVRGAFNGDDVQLASWSADFRKLVIYAQRSDSSDYHLIDLDQQTARLLAPSFPMRAPAAFDRTGVTAAVDIRRAAAARIEDPRRLCTDVRNTG